MKGKIFEINQKRGMVAVLTESENFSIFEILTYDNFEIDDEVSWTENHPLGDCKIKNLTKNEMFIAYFQNHWITKDNLRKQMLY